MMKMVMRMMMIMMMLMMMKMIFMTIITIKNKCDDCQVEGVQE